MKRCFFLPITALVLSLLACSFLIPRQQETTPSPQIMADTFFSGYAYIDSNQNGKLDPEDQRLQGAIFLLEGFRETTDSNGMAFVTIPGGWDQPVNARMQAPEGSEYVLLSPGEVVLQSGKQNKAEFLFTGPQQ